jgi:hypothetical protein
MPWQNGRTYQPGEKSREHKRVGADDGSAAPLPPETHNRDQSGHAQELPADCAPKHAELREPLVPGDGVDIDDRYVKLPQGALHRGQGNDGCVRFEALRWIRDDGHGDDPPQPNYTV